ncbi:hypothetical protein AXF42_Ash009873 [Apostasia shenzhenica]|uniref:Uncharacterized protein n=1 Tax=Apostasia shenzhenica TaxID=1088818 RepID=A0A2I0AC68_9ASPA|nr:hypothetical protein AXF42_Ash009873 [Apostasia shenzhenica]
MPGISTAGDGRSLGGPKQCTGSALLAPASVRGNHLAPIEPSMWRDEQRMKEELIAWAKAVASISIAAIHSSQGRPDH